MWTMVASYDLLVLTTAQLGPSLASLLPSALCLCISLLVFPPAQLCSARSYVSVNVGGSFQFVVPGAWASGVAFSMGGDQRKG